MEAFLGVPQTIDPPKRYPKTPIPGRAGDKPQALLDDSNTAAAPANEAPTGAGALFGGRRQAPARKGSFAAAPPMVSPTSISFSASAGSSPASPSITYTHPHRAPPQSNPALNVLVYLFVYILLVGVLATAAALDPAKARNCALSILGLSFGASLLVSRAFAQAHHLQHQQLQQHFNKAA